MKGLVVKKSLIGKQDLLLGRQSETQQRGGGLVNIEGIQYIYPVKTLGDLKNLNPKEFETAFLFGENTLDVIDPEFQLLDANINEFYYFDFTNTDDEKVPDVVKSNVTEFGRWVLSRVGEKRLYRLAIPLIQEVVASKTPEIAKQVKDEVNILLTDQIRDETKSLKKQGLLFDSKLEYENGDIAKVLVKTNAGVQQKTFILNNAENIKVSNPPLEVETDKIGNIPVYQDTTYSVEGWKFLPSYNQAYKICHNTNKSVALSIFKNVKVQPVGDIRIRIFDIFNAVHAQFDVEFAGFALTNFKIKNVFYSDSVKANPPVPIMLDNFAMYPGFCIGAIDEEFKLMTISKNHFNRIEVDYKNCSVEPLCEYTDEMLPPNNYYAVREGGGSYIPNLGQVFNYFWGENEAGISRKFRLFMLGQVEWATNLTLNKSCFHQYFKYVGEMGDPNIDVSDVFIRNVGMFEAKPGKLVNPQLPNIKGGWDYQEYNKGEVRYAWRDHSGDGTGQHKQKYWGAFKRGRYNTKIDLHTNSVGYDSSFGWQFDASEYSHVYNDKGDTRPKSITTILALQAF